LKKSALLRGDHGRAEGDAGGAVLQFSIERHVPGDHLLRSIDRFVDLSDPTANLGAIRAGSSSVKFASAWLMRCRFEKPSG
jgi:hypothetical protein